MHIDDSACNLSSLNVLKFRTDDGSFDVATFEHAVDVMFLAQEIVVGYSSYPTPEIGRNAKRFRQLGLGYANLGALLMARGLPYDSDEGRAYAAAITAIMTGRGYRKSAEIAKRIGPHAGYAENAAAMPGVIPKAIGQFKNAGRPVIAGGMVTTRTEVIDALAAGAVGDDVEPVVRPRFFGGARFRPGGAIEDRAWDAFGGWRFVVPRILLAIDEAVLVGVDVRTTDVLGQTRHVGATIGLSGQTVVIRIFDPEEFPDIGEALWFTLQTVTTVGYGRSEGAPLSGLLNQDTPEGSATAASPPSSTCPPRPPSPQGCVNAAASATITLYVFCSMPRWSSLPIFQNKRGEGVSNPRGLTLYSHRKS